MKTQSGQKHYENVMDQAANKVRCLAQPEQRDTKAHAERLAETLEKTLDIISGDQAAELGVYDALNDWRKQ